MTLVFVGLHRRHMSDAVFEVQIMRLWKVFFMLVVCAGLAPLFLFGLAGAQTAPRRVLQPAAQSGSTGAALKVHATLAQVMTGILFPNYNVIFFAQSKDAAVLPTD